MYDVLIKNSMVISGDGTPAFAADVALRGEYIVAVGCHLPEPAAVELDATGLIVCPGFIDIHSHSDISLIADPLGQSKLLQGVTSEVIGNCGLSPFPLYDDLRRKSLSFIDVASVDWDWQSASDYLKRLQQAGPAINTLALVGHGALRAAIMGYENKKATAEDLKAMGSLLSRCFEAGVWGLSTGLGYAPDFYSDEDELCALAEVVKQYNRVFSFHIRGERKTLFKAVSEAINVSRRTGANVQVSHLKCCDIMNYGRMNELLSLFDAASAEGLPVNFDQYPYTAGSSYLGLLFPPWVHEGGMDCLMKRLDDAVDCARMKADMDTGTQNWSSILAVSGGDNVMITSVSPGGNREYEGKFISELAAQRKISSIEMALRIMQEERGQVEIVMFQQEEADLKLAMQHHLGMFGSDGFAFDLQGAISKGSPHPRSYGTFPRILAKYVREEHVISLEAAIRKMTQATANKLGIQNRGLIHTGYYADLVVFDYSAVQDNAEYTNPIQAPSGINYVIVNGKIAAKNGVHTGQCAGHVLRKGELP